jgi:hypothetical protein
MLVELASVPEFDDSFYIYLKRYCVEPQLNGGRKGSGLNQHITQNTAKLQDVPLQTKKKKSSNLHFHPEIIGIDFNHSILNPSFYYFMLNLSVFKILIISVYFILREF